MTLSPFVDIRAEVDDGKVHLRDPWAAERIVVHRILFGDLDPDSERIAIDTCLRFVEDENIVSVTGGELPYCVLIDGRGVKSLALAFSDIGRHARKYNSKSLSVAVIGDTRKKPPTRQQYNETVDCLAELCPAHDIDPLGADSADVPYLAGHDEFPGGSSDPNKQCPGIYMPMAQVRHDVADRIANNARQRLLAAKGVA